MIKYDIYIGKNSLRENIDRLTNQMWKLIPMRENGEDWKKQLETVILEVVGFHSIFYDNPLFLQLLLKLEGLLVQSTTFLVYRKTVFEAIDLIQQCKGEVQ